MYRKFILKIRLGIAINKGITYTFYLMNKNVKRNAAAGYASLRYSKI